MIAIYADIPLNLKRKANEYFLSWIEIRIHFAEESKEMLNGIFPEKIARTQFKKCMKMLHALYACCKDDLVHDLSPLYSYVFYHILHDWMIVQEDEGYFIKDEDDERKSDEYFIKKNLDKAEIYLDYCFEDYDFLNIPNLFKNFYNNEKDNSEELALEYEKNLELFIKKNRLREIHEGLLNRLNKQILLFQNLIDHFGECRVINRNSSKSIDIFMDYIYYCLTKSCKSLSAVKILIKKNFPEDALILLRSIYENYLHIAYLVKNPHELDKFVSFKIGIKLGKIKHPLKKGWMNKRKILHPHTNEEILVAISTTDLAKGTYFSSDLLVHNSLYEFLSEHTHPHMIASSNYHKNNQKHYTYKNKDKLVQVPFFSNYISMVLLQQMLFFEEIDKNTKKKISNEIKQTKDIILQLIEFLDSENKIDPSFRDQFRNRINE